MASLTLPTSNSVFTSLRLNKPTQASFRTLDVFPCREVRFSGYLGRRQNARRLEVVTRAGPSTSSLIFAFVFPLSLVAFTVFTSIRIADKLDRDFLEELALNQAMKDVEDNDEALPASVEEEPALPRTRNRPKRGA
ncbi:PREDICTED: uncharacterized protein LOC104608894 [Nelumbo nucifera]|uniref:High chlorophyll fluorescence 153 n=2 Tax=Nelumbo nucifera TaxID=4432 RepID=A0A822ZDA2_NELNU|nr:PREDICTED: uncharacterized protein LOC104608894 [Nelumbo nucifera]DAD42543.1 TPA_asm: hypothetical protein HUJ06_000773 [Nelumbo nucifera]